jgi:hypothetical protein
MRAIRTRQLFDGGDQVQSVLGWRILGDDLMRTRPDTMPRRIQRSEIVTTSTENTL